MKKTVVIIMTLAMVMCFAGCGDSGASNEGQKEPTAEPNAGIEGIVYTMPDGWEQTADSEANYIGYANPDSDFEFGNMSMNEESIKMMKEEDPAGPETVQEYYEDLYSLSDQEMKEQNIETDTTEVCGAEAKVQKVKKSDEGYVDIGTTWISGGVCYELWIAGSDIYDDNGNMLEDAAVLSDEDIAMYESVIASITPGDGTKYQPSSK